MVAGWDEMDGMDGEEEDTYCTQICTFIHSSRISHIPYIYHTNIYCMLRTNENIINNVM